MALQEMETVTEVKYRLAGEDAPVWPGVIAAGLGLMLALAVGAEIMRPAPPRQSFEAPTTAAPASARSAAELKGPPAFAAGSETGAAPALSSAPKWADLPLGEWPVSLADGAGDAPEARAETPAPVRQAAICAPVISIPFEINSAKVKYEDMGQAVAPLRDWLLAHPEAVLSVEGHADATGGEAFNLLLSFSRAQAVAAWLERVGAPKERIAPRAAGTNPPTVAPANVVSNRQVILQIEGVEPCRDSGLSALIP